MPQDFGKARLLVVGLDSATFTVLSPLMDRGQLPNLRRLMQQGASGLLRSVIPPLSPAAWVSTMTGLNPGAHGVFDFRHLDTNVLHGRTQTPVLSSAYAGLTIFDLLSERGLRVGAFGIPLTYPAWPVNGVMVAGPVTPDRRTVYSYPPELAQRLGPLATDSAPTTLKELNLTQYLEELIWETQHHFAYGRKLLEEDGPFDLFWFHLHALDSAQHRFWEYTPGLTETPVTDLRFGTALEQLYCLADEGLGLLLEACGQDTTVVVLSDHGARGRPQKTLCLNAWLNETGHLVFRNAGALRRFASVARRQVRIWLGVRYPGTIEMIDWRQTAAYYFPLADPVGGLVINLQGRQPNGSVSVEDYPAVRQKIMDELLAWRDPQTGQAVITQAWLREDLYSGPFVEQAPDILFMAASEYQLDGQLSGVALGPTPPPQPDSWLGIHDMDGVLFVSSPNVKSNLWIRDATLLDIVPTLLPLLHQPLRANLDGQPLWELFRDVDQPERATTAASGPAKLAKGANGGLSEEEANAMLNHLRALGYVR